MSRTTPILKIKNTGTLLGGGAFTTLDFQSPLSGSDSGNGVAAVNDSGGGSGQNIATEVVAAVTSGSNITLDLTTLSHTFVAVEVVFRNGQGTTPVTDWSLTGSTVTVTGASSAEIFMIQYSY